VAEATRRELDRCVDVSRSRFAERRQLRVDPGVKPELREPLRLVLEGCVAAVREVAHGPPGSTPAFVDDLEAQRRRGRGDADVEEARGVGESRAGVADRVERRPALLADGLDGGAALPHKIESEHRRRRRVRVQDLDDAVVALVRDRTCRPLRRVLRDRRPKRRHEELLERRGERQDVGEERQERGVLRAGHARLDAAHVRHLALEAAPRLREQREERTHGGEHVGVGRVRPLLEDAGPLRAELRDDGCRHVLDERRYAERRLVARPRRTVGLVDREQQTLRAPAVLLLPGGQQAAEQVVAVVAAECAAELQDQHRVGPEPLDELVGLVAEDVPRAEAVGELGDDQVRRALRPGGRLQAFEPYSFCELRGEGNNVAVEGSDLDTRLRCSLRRRLDLALGPLTQLHYRKGSVGRRRHDPEELRKHDGVLEGARAPVVPAPDADLDAAALVVLETERDFLDAFRRQIQERPDHGDEEHSAAALARGRF